MAYLIINEEPAALAGCFYPVANGVSTVGSVCPTTLLAIKGLKASPEGR